MFHPCDPRLQCVINKYVSVASCLLSVVVLEYCLNRKPGNNHIAASCSLILMLSNTITGGWAGIVHRITWIRRHHHRAAVPSSPSLSLSYHPVPLSETMQSMFSATQPENACSARYVDPNVPWVPSPRPQPHSEFNPYENERTNAVNHQHRPDGPVIPLSWEVSLASANVSGTAASMRGVCFGQNAKVPCDPFSRKRKGWSLMKKLRRYLGTTAFPA